MGEGIEGGVMGVDEVMMHRYHWEDDKRQLPCNSCGRPFSRPFETSTSSRRMTEDANCASESVFAIQQSNAQSC